MSDRHPRHAFLVALAAAALLIACGGGAASPPPAASSPEETAAPDPLAALNARAKAAGAITETLHGVEVADPYRALETMSPLTEAWIDAQSEHTREALAGGLDAAARARLEAIESAGAIAGPALAGSRVFYLDRGPDDEQYRLVVVPDGGGAPRTLVDATDWGERAALDWFYPSPDGAKVAFGISRNGDERSTLHVLDVERGERLPDVIPRAKWCRLAWREDGGGFWYTRYPAPGEPDWDEARPESYHRRLFFHALGDDPASDPLVFSPLRKTDSVSPSLSADGRWLVLNSFQGWSASDVYVLDRGRRRAARVVAPDDRHPLVPVSVGVEAIHVGHVHGGRLHLLTNREAPRYRVLVADDPARAGEPGALRELVPEDPEAVIEEWAFTRDRLLLKTVEDVANRVRVVDLRGRRRDDLPLPDRSAVTALGADDRGDQVILGVEGYLVPESVRVVTVGRERSTRVVAEVPNDVDLDALESRLVSIPSTGGVQVPATVLAPKDVGPRPPVIVTGYGGFNIAILPRFRRSALFWLERGGVWIVANLRGGSERGEAWHRAGNREKKENVFDDFEAVLRWVVTSGLSTADRIGITGRSNGGLLMGAAITRAPDAFAAAAAYVGLYDMARFHHFPPAQLWTGEYGDPEVAEELAWLLRYSPYHQVSDGTAYPAVLIETAEADTRVHWAHSTKLAARLQEANASEEPIYFYMQRQMGHGRGSRRSDLVAQDARMFAFFEAELGD